MQAVLINDLAVRQDLHPNHKFLYGYRILKIPFPIQELLKSDHRKINNFTLRFCLRREDDYFTVSIIQ